MGNVYTETFLLRPAQCDMKNAWKPSAILEMMQDTAGMHSILLGVDRDTMLANGEGTVWVITRLKLEMTRMPKAGEQITIETYPTPMRHMFCPRSHIFRDADGVQIGSANSLWVTMDVETRRITKSDFVAAHLPDNSDLQPAAGTPATVRALAGEVTEDTVTPQYTDLDVNEHVNNTKYLDWCCNALGIETMQNMCLMHFDVNYDLEIRPGTQIRTELTREGDKFCFSGYSGEKKHFSIGGTLTPRG